MNAETRIAPDLRRPTRPRSAVSAGVGVAGLVGLVAWVAIARTYQFSGPHAALCAVAACGGPMLLWSVFVDKVYRSPTTGLDWASPPRPLGESLDFSLVKIAGLWATWAGLAFVYCMARWYWSEPYYFAMASFAWAAAPLLALSIPYVIWTDRRLKEPRDGAWHFAQLVFGRSALADREAVYEHLRCWTIKGFFLAFMVAVVPGNWSNAITPTSDQIVANLGSLTRWLIAAMFMIDTSFATIGYVLTMKPLDAHIRSANPYAAGWTAALICYPPFVLMADGGPLDYHPGTLGEDGWAYWLAGYPLLMTLFAFAMVVLTAIYAWATVAFGLRFSNLTHRGVLTHGPYGWTKHPAYLSKNLFWWLCTLPFFATTGNLTDAIRNTFIMGLVSGVYYWRARTEERHLSADPHYRDYAAWMAEHGAITRLLTRRPRPLAPERLPAE
ncbi:MAG: methyltransferase family protein [Allosphingosinicella sp.]